MKRRSYLFRLFMLLLIPFELAVGQNDGVLRGAYKMPYIRYEADIGLIGGGGEVRGPSMDQSKIESEASERKYVALPNVGSFVEWIINETVRGITLRFTMPDSPDGTGLIGSLALYVNNEFISNIELSSYFAWQYYYKKPGKDTHPHNDPEVGNPRMRFDEINWILPVELKKGDVVRFQKNESDGIEYGIDFIEVEPVPDPIQKPYGFVDVTEAPFNAIPNDEGDDYNAFKKAIDYAYANNTGVYIPKGKFLIGDQIQLNKDNLRILGAGIWHTKLHFTQKPSGNRGGGIYANGSNLHVSDFSMSSELNYRGGYRAFGQYWGQNSIIENIWLNHFSVGFWIADYTTGKHNIADGLIVRNCRIRNIYADGLNFAKGSSNCILEHSNIRNTGDDAMASWSSNVERVGPNTFNTFRFNTVENTNRAAGLGIFGGQQHVAHHCIILDSFAGSGIRLNSTFEAHPFADDSFINIFEMSVVRCGTRDNIWGNKLGGLDFNIRYYDVNNIRFNTIDLIDSQTDGIYINQAIKGYSMYDVYFSDVNIIRSGTDGLGPGYGIAVSNNTDGWIQNTKVDIQNPLSGDISESSAGFEIRTVSVGNNKRPYARAGNDVFLYEGQTELILDGSESYDPEGETLFYQWFQIAGTPVTLEGKYDSVLSITGLDPNQKYLFKLEVSDGQLSGHDVVYVGPIRQ